MQGVLLVGTAALNALDHAGLSTLLTLLQGVAVTVPAAWLAGRVWGLPGVFGGVALGYLVGGLATNICLGRVRAKGDIDAVSRSPEP